MSPAGDGGQIPVYPRPERNASACSSRHSALALHIMPSAAQSPKAPATQPGNWQMTVGAGVRIQPGCEGSDRFPIACRASIGFGHAGIVRCWSAEDDAISIGLVNGDNWRAGAGAAPLMPRTGKDPRRLRGLDKVPFGVEIGGFGE
jgi:outer membrane scaffolding protein for murein synthesis (MipA/OmpV family)